MKIVLWLVVAIVVLVGLVATVGSLVPKQHVAARAARYQQPPDSLWRALTDFGALPRWAPEMKKVERLADRNGHPVWLHTGARWSAPMEVVEFDAPRRFSMRIADPKLPFGGTWTYEIAAVEGGSLVTVTEKGTIESPIFRFLARFVFGHTSTQDAYLKALGRKFGEGVVPAPGTAAS